MMKTFVEKFNYTLKLVLSTVRWGQIYENLTVTGAQNDVYTGKADILIGKIILKKR